MYLKAQRTRGSVRGHRGFTIIEMVVATFLMALLALLLAAAVATFARPAAEVDGRTRLALEASLAAEALARDLGGYLVDTSGAPGNLQQYQFSSWSFSADGSILFLNFQGATRRTSLPDRDVPAARRSAGPNPVEQRAADGGRRSMSSASSSSRIPTIPPRPGFRLTLTYPDPLQSAQEQP